MPEVEDRWFPPSPHREAVLGYLEQGRAHIEERGHNVAPLIAFEDGGVMELPSVRFDKERAFWCEPGGATRHTLSSDVCGAIDEIRRRLEKPTETEGPEPERLGSLIEDACYMLRRMQRRREHYEEFARALCELAERAAAIGGPNLDDAETAGDALQSVLAQGLDVPRLVDLAEQVRDAANKMEQSLYAHRDLAIDVNRAYEKVRGGRDWSRKKSES